MIDCDLVRNLSIFLHRDSAPPCENRSTDSGFSFFASFLGWGVLGERRTVWRVAGMVPRSGAGYQRVRRADFSLLQFLHTDQFRTDKRSHVDWGMQSSGAEARIFRGA